MRTDSETLAANVLEERLEGCEHAQAIGTCNIMTVPLKNLKIHIAKTSNLWGKFPLKLQVSLSERHALEEFFEAVDFFKKEKHWQPALEKFLAYFEWGNCTSFVMDNVKDFKAISANFLSPLSAMLRTAGDLQEESLLLSGFSEGDVHGKRGCDAEAEASGAPGSEKQKEINPVLQHLQEGVQAG